MAKTRKKSTVRKAKPAASRKRQTRTKGRSIEIGRFVAGGIVILLLVAGIVTLGAYGLRAAASSSFFALREIKVRGTDRVATEDVKRAALSRAEKAGSVFDADLSAMREAIEKLPFVRSASLSLSLPNSVAVDIKERVPVAIVKMAGGDRLVDAEGVILAAARGSEPTMPFAMRGWDERKTEDAIKGNVARVKAYRKMIDEFKALGVAERVVEVDLTDTRQPSAVVTEGGRNISVVLAKDEFGKSLYSAIDAIAGKGDRVRSVNSVGVSPILEYLTY